MQALAGEDAIGSLLTVALRACSFPHTAPTVVLQAWAMPSGCFQFTGVSRRFPAGPARLPALPTDSRRQAEGHLARMQARKSLLNSNACNLPECRHCPAAAAATAPLPPPCRQTCSGSRPSLGPLEAAGAAVLLLQPSKSCLWLSRSGACPSPDATCGGSSHRPRSRPPRLRQQPASRRSRCRCRNSSSSWGSSSSKRCGAALVSC